MCHSLNIHFSYVNITEKSRSFFLYSLVVNGIRWADGLEKLYTGLVKARWDPGVLRLLALLVSRRRCRHCRKNTIPKQRGAIPPPQHFFGRSVSIFVMLYVVYARPEEGLKLCIPAD